MGQGTRTSATPGGSSLGNASGGANAQMTPMSGYRPQMFAFGQPQQGWQGFGGPQVTPAARQPGFAQMMQNLQGGYAVDHARNFGMLNQGMAAPANNQYMPWMLQGFTSPEAQAAAAPTPLSQAAPAPINAGIAALPGGYAQDYQTVHAGGADAGGGDGGFGNGAGGGGGLGIGEGGLGY